MILDFETTFLPSKFSPLVLPLVKFSPSLLHIAMLIRWAIARVVQPIGRSLHYGVTSLLDISLILDGIRQSHSYQVDKCWWVLHWAANLWMFWRMLVRAISRFLLPSPLSTPSEVWGTCALCLGSSPLWPALLVAKGIATWSREIWISQFSGYCVSFNRQGNISC